MLCVCCLCVCQNKLCVVRKVDVWWHTLRHCKFLIRCIFCHFDATKRLGCKKLYPRKYNKNLLRRCVLIPIASPKSLEATVGTIWKMPSLCTKHKTFVVKIHLQNASNKIFWKKSLNTLSFMYFGIWIFFFFFVGHTSRREFALSTRQEKVTFLLVFDPKIPSKSSDIRQSIHKVRKWCLVIKVLRENMRDLLFLDVFNQANFQYPTKKNVHINHFFLGVSNNFGFWKFQSAESKFWLCNPTSF